MRFLVLSWIFLLVLPALAFAQNREVDIELVLAVDVSRSMSPAELELQRRGYAEALTSKDVITAIEGGLLGRVALTYIEWAGTGAQRVVVPWTEVAGAEDARAVADTLSAVYDDSLRRTSISGALRHAARSMDANRYDGLRRVIDISGDGPNNMGPPVRSARAEVIAQGITINGLPLMTQDALSEIWGIPNLDVYYSECVTGGPGSFVIPVLDWAQFPDAVRRKLVLEIAGITPPPALAPPAPRARVIPAQASDKVAFDCLVGEKMWRQNRSFFDIP